MLRYNKVPNVSYLEQHENEEFLQLDAEALKAGDDELDDQIAIKDSENLDKEDNEFIVWANGVIILYQR